MHLLCCDGVVVWTNAAESAALGVERARSAAHPRKPDHLKLCTADAPTTLRVRDTESGGDRNEEE